ncbi:MAG: sigma-70 family RNA polymerase sigma factor [Desulfotomaculaceae bacterium]|nr:sigma-70 family RNA polymerase sigma factor [Desulfotomaculaceae bacterium]
MASRDQTTRPELENAINCYIANKSDKSLQELVAAGESLVHHFARVYSGRRSPDDDLLQAGYEGLLKAVRRFDPGRNVRFATFASHCIMGEIRHELRRKASADRPGWLFDLQSRVYRAIEEHVQRTGQPPSNRELAEAVNVREEGVTQLLRAGTVSLEELDLSRIKNLRYESFKLPLEDRISLIKAMQNLGELQKKVVYFIFYEDLTQTQVAEKLRISQRQVSRLMYRALSKMKEFLSG